MTIPSKSLEERKQSWWNKDMNTSDKKTKFFVYLMGSLVGGISAITVVYVLILNGGLIK